MASTHNWVKPGATVIDVGINRVPAPEKGEGKTRLVGDCDYDSCAEVAGAIIGPDTLARGGAARLDAESALAVNDAHGFFGRMGGQVVTGPTLTNVNDFRAMIVHPV